MCAVARGTGSVEPVSTSSDQTVAHYTVHMPLVGAMRVPFQLQDAFRVASVDVAECLVVLEWAMRVLVERKVQLLLVIIQ